MKITTNAQKEFHRPEQKPDSEQKVENILVALLYSQTACWLKYLFFAR
jgi:hypothetical protein